MVSIRSRYTSFTRRAVAWEPFPSCFVTDVSQLHRQAFPTDLYLPIGPGSFIEVAKILPLLANPDSQDQPCFDDVAPSLPNFGFSSGPSKPGFALEQYAESCHKLMLKLGYSNYATQGGDWGYGITRFMDIRYGPASSSATKKSGAVLASHINHNLAVPPSISTIPQHGSLVYLKYLFSTYSKREKEGLARTHRFWEEGAAYNGLHCHNPTTIGIALRDSPVALLSWIYEKLYDWTDSYPWTDDEILTWISIYQFASAGPKAGCRIYYHSATAKKVEEYNPGVKLGVSTFPKDLLMSPSYHYRTLGPLVFENWHNKGGHFAAWEVPELLVEDMRVMFGGLVKSGEINFPGPK